MIIANLKKLLLVYVPRIVPANFLIKYWLYLSFGQRIFTGHHYIRSIDKFESNISKDLYLLKATDGQLLIQNLSRISRFLRGKNHAANRLYSQYTNNLLSLKTEYESKSNLVFLDIGANIGEFSIAIAQNFVNSHIYAFEPDPVAFECLKYNVSTSNLSNRVSIFNLALSDKSGYHPFFISTKNADSSFIKPKSFTEIIKVQSSRGNEFMIANKIESVALLKMDAEGFEPEIISSFGEQITSIKFFAIDVGPERNGEETGMEIAKFLESRGMLTKIYSNEGTRKFLNACWR